MVHRETIEEFSGSLDDLAVAIGHLRYDSLARFPHCLSTKLERDAAADADRGRPKLAAALHTAAGSVADSALAIDEAWVIAAPRM